jgi:YggT family protein
MDGLIASLIVMIVDIYIVLLFVRMFATTSERYDAVLGMVFKATDPVVVPVANTLSVRNTQLVPVVLMAGLILFKGLLLRSVPQALQGFIDTLLKLYVLIVIIISVFREFYVNPIAGFAQRIVRPVRALAATVSQHLPTVNLLSVAGLIVLHVVLTLLLQGLFGPGAAMGLPIKSAFIYSLGLIVDLTWFFIMVIFINAILSWVSPDPLNPIVQLLALISAPIVEPIRRFVPPVGGMIDISPMIAFFALLILNDLGHSLLRLL